MTEENIQKDLTTSEDDHILKEMREKEEAKVTKCIALVKESHEIYKSLSETDRQRVDMAMDELSSEKEEKE